MPSAEHQLPELPPSAVGSAHFFAGQGLHALLLFALLVGAFTIAGPSLGDGGLFGVGDHVWFHAAVWVAVVHQVVVWLAWRAQLRWSTFTRIVGTRDITVWTVLFMPMLLARPLLILALAMADAGSLELSWTVAATLAVVFAIPSVWTLWSVARYFGIERAVGGDHFRERVRRMPAVDGGAFAHTPNAMYVLAFLGLWAIALAFGSHAALVAACFQHAYIQVHWLCTEKPDMDLLYGGVGESPLVGEREDMG